MPLRPTPTPSTPRTLRYPPWLLSHEKHEFSLSVHVSTGKGRHHEKNLDYIMPFVHKNSGIIVDDLTQFNLHRPCRAFMSDRILSNRLLGEHLSRMPHLVDQIVSRGNRIKHLPRSQSIVAPGLLNGTRIVTDEQDTT